MATTKKPRYTLQIEAPANGRIRAATVTVLDVHGNTAASDLSDLSRADNRRKVGKSLARQLGEEDSAKWEKDVEEKWKCLLDQNRRIHAQQIAGSAEAVAVETLALLDAEERCIRRPLCLIDGIAYAAHWASVRREKEGEPSATERVLCVVRGDGALFADVAVAGAKPLSQLELDVRLPATLPPGREWSGAGVKRYLAGERPDPAEVFGRVVGVVNRFIDFARSLAPQETLCEMAACFVLSTYFLDALNVVGYLWPNGERGTGKTSFLQVVAELSYLGQVILAGSSYPCLRDMADYGATLCFDDAEAVMDARRTDPDKRTLLLAGSRRGATIAVKELSGDGKTWETRHVSTFCPRLFSAIRTPDEVLGSRSIMVPLVRSGDPRRAKANPLDPVDWPTDRRRLIDDLWALGLTHLPEMPKWERFAAEHATLCGRNLDPWRPILAVAAWLEDRGVEGLYERMERLSRDYQTERGEIEDADKTRVLFRALLALSEGWEAEQRHSIQPKNIADAMNEIAKTEDLAEPDKQFTTPRKAGWLLKRQRFHRAEGRNEKGKLWTMTRGEIVLAASAYGVVADEGATI